MKRFVSVWLPHWPIERMRRSDPNSVPHDRPFALVANSAHGLRITAINSVAEWEGARTGLSLADQRAALPMLLSRPAEPAADARALVRLARWLGRYGPARNTEGPDGVWIDISGAAHLFGGEEALCADLISRLARFGLTARVGVADTPGAAYALARFAPPPFALAPPDKTQQALSPLPVEALRLEAETARLLRRLGLRRIGLLTALARSALEHRFRDAAQSRSARTQSALLARAVLMRLDQALGTLSEPRRALGEPPVCCVRRSWSEPWLSSEALSHEIERLCHDLARTLAQSGLGAMRITLSLYRADGSVAEVHTGLSRPSADGSHLMDLLRDRLTAVDAGFGIDAAGLQALRVERTAALQDSLGAPQTANAEAALATLVDRLTNRLGRESVFSLSHRESHIPERSQIRTAPFAPAPAEPAALRSRTRRPILLLTPPEPIGVMAEVPEGPPLRFTWRRVHYAVAHSQGPERIAPEWWRHLAPAHGERAEPNAAPPEPSADDGLGEIVIAPPAHQTRDYYIVEARDGARFWLYRDGLYGHATGPPRWFLHGLF